MGVRPAVGQPQAAPLKCFRQGLGVGDDLALQLVELVGLGNVKGHRQRRELVHVGAALLAGEDRHVNDLGQFLVCGQDHRATRPADGLVGGKGSHVGNTYRVGVDAGGGHPGGVGDIGHQVGPHLVGDGAEGFPVRRPGVRGVPGDDHPRPVLLGQVADTIIVQLLRPGIHAVGDRPVPLAGDVKLRTVGQVTTLEEVQPHQRVPWLHQCPVGGQVGRRAGERLDVDVDMLGAKSTMGKELGATPLGQALDKVDIVHSLVKAPVGVAAVESQLPGHVLQPLLWVARHPQRRIPLGVDILEDRAQRLADGPGGIGLGGDQNELARLALCLPADEIGHKRFDFFQIGTQEKIGSWIGVRRRHWTHTPYARYGGIVTLRGNEGKSRS